MVARNQSRQGLVGMVNSTDAILTDKKILVVLKQGRGMA